MKVGDKAPDFTLPDQNGNQFNFYSNLKGKSLLVFYPKDYSMVCTKQLCDYRDNYEFFVKAGYNIIGISSDSVESHKEFADKFNFGFTLLSDVNKHVCRIYEALGVTGMPKRKIIALDEEGTILYIDSRIPLFYRNSSFLLNLFNNDKRLDN